MTFTMKGYNDVAKQFHKIVKIVLERDKKIVMEDFDTVKDKTRPTFLAEYIAKLDDGPRKEQLNFIAAFMKDLETTKLPKEQQTKALYGAILVVCRDIEKKEGYVLEKKENSVVYTGLRKDAMGINPPQSVPTDLEYAEFYQAFNSVMNRVFVKNDSREGWNKEHPFRTIKAETLLSFVEMGYVLEQASQDEFVKHMSKDGKSKQPSGQQFKVQPAIKNELVKQFGDFISLSKKLESLEDHELSQKSKSNVNLLNNAVRTTQYQFLKTIALALKNMKLPDADKVAVLAGAMYIVRGEIATAYKKSTPLYKKPINATYTQNGSVTHIGLTEILGSEKASYEDMAVLIEATNQFIRFMCIESPAENKAPLFRAKTMFSDIANFNLATVLIEIQKMLLDSRHLALKVCLDQVKLEAEKNKTPSKSIFDGYFGSFFSSKSTVKEESEEEDLEETEEATATGNKNAMVS